MNIERVDTYVDDSSGPKKIYVKTRMDNHSVRYQGEVVATIIIQMVNPMGATQEVPKPIRLSFDIPASCLEEAFTRFDELAKVELGKRAKAEEAEMEKQVKKIQHMAEGRTEGGLFIPGCAPVSPVSKGSKKKH